jgi:hypothetical protein
MQIKLLIACEDEECLSKRITLEPASGLRAKDRLA